MFFLPSPIIVIIASAGLENPLLVNQVTNPTVRGSSLTYGILSEVFLFDYSHAA
jgi:hypothetical protein